jgi:uncharacterized protein (UPF0264 family)
MTGMLASVNSIEEAMLVLDAQVDIIDLKQPALGALGALDNELVEAIVRKIDGKCPVSATVGDLPMNPETVFNAVATMAATGVDYIKIGFFPGGDWPGTISGLARLTQQGHQLIAVLFADTHPDCNIINLLAENGFTGVMLDTMDKQKGSLPTLMCKNEINDFVMQAKAHRLLCGLAGSLREADIAELQSLNPDYLGFRGALCNKLQRTALLDKNAVFNIKQALVH